jgi:hypothetical protein
MTPGLELNYGRLPSWAGGVVPSMTEGMTR